ncbi:MAG: hypothetical protein JSW27_23680 [Phycisphaerales bacterium]|nr:MAG: hypothetical protein JSW27_23680 [Phycisphaerales bacterium]
MSTPKVRTAILALCVCAALAPSVGAQSLAAGHREQARLLLEKLEQQIGRIRNFRCQKITPVIPVSATSDSDVTRYRQEWLTCDQQGRGRVRLSEEGRITTQIWDGEKTVNHLVQVDPNGTVTHQVSVAAGINYDIQRQQEPWDYLGRDLTDLLTTALDGRAAVRVSEMEAERYRVDVRDDTGALHTILLDAQQGYAPIYRRVYVNGEVQRLETVTFEETGNGIWFPVEIMTEVGPQQERLPEPILKYRFTNVTVNNWDFERSLQLGLAEGTEVQDGITGQTYIVGEDSIESLPPRSPAPVDVNTPEPPPAEETAVPAWQEAFDAAYQLEEGEVLKCIAPPFIPERYQYLVRTDPNLADQADRILQNRLFQFAWDDGLQNQGQVASSRLLGLSAVLENVVGLRSYEYDGLPHLLNLSVTGDWIVRKDASTEQLLINLEHIIQQQRQWSIAFAKERVDTIVVRASGTYQFQPLPGLAADDGVQLHAGDPDSLGGRPNLGTTCDIVAHFLEDLGHSIGMAVVDNTQLPEAELCWVRHDSAQLRRFRNTPAIYNPQLISLLNNLTSQTGLTFTVELGALDQWQVSAQRNVATRGN